MNAIAHCKDDDIALHILGEGSKEETERFKQLAETLGIGSKVMWYGQVSHTEVLKQMRESDLLFFTSIIEGTPHVVLESIQECLPVVCFNTCGQGEVVNESVGMKIEVSNPNDSVEQFSTILHSLYNDRKRLSLWRENCEKRAKELTWDGKARQMVGIYENIRR